MDRHGLHDDHPGATERPLAVVADVPLAGQAALGHVRGVRPEGDPAAQRPVAERQRFEDVREVGRTRRHAVVDSRRRSGGRRGLRRPAGDACGQQGDDPADRRRRQDHQVDEQAHRERLIARDPEAVGDQDHGQLERARVSRARTARS